MSSILSLFTHFLSMQPFWNKPWESHENVTVKLKIEAKKDEFWRDEAIMTY